MNIPSALVLGCNDPVTVGVLFDWILDHCGFEVNFWESGWDDLNNGITWDHRSGSGYGIGYGRYSNDGEGCGDWYGYGNRGDGVGMYGTETMELGYYFNNDVFTFTDGFLYGGGNGSGDGSMNDVGARTIIPYGNKNGNGSGNGFGY